MNPSDQITEYIASLKDWRGKTLGRLRRLVLQADPAMTEEWKWGTPVFSHNGQVLALGAFGDHVKINFFKGASVKDPRRLFNAGKDAKTSRAIDLQEGNPIDEAALKDLIQGAVALNAGGGKSAQGPKAKAKTRTKAKKGKRK